MTRSLPCRCALVLAAALISTATPALAQGTGDEASAQQLFDQGRTLLQQGHLAEACSKFAASQQLAPSGGTLLNLADCYEKNGQLASAWAKFREVASRAQRAGRADVEQIANDRVKQIEPRLSFLTIVVPPAADVDGLEIRRDGELSLRAAWGAPLPVDGGDHTIHVTAPGKLARVIPTHVRPTGDRVTVTLAPLETSPVSSSPGGAETDDTSRRRRATFQRSLALVAGGAGVVALGVGIVFGVKAISKNDEAMALCPASPRCDDPAGVTLTDDAKSAATVSTVTFIAGGVLVAGGVALYLTAPSSSPAKAARHPRVLVGTAPVGLGPAIGGTW
jgi:hypothetical protein